MSPIKRSSDRLKKIQFKNVQQNEFIFRSSLSDCGRTRIDDFEKREFLSLFELVPNSMADETEINFIEPIIYKEFSPKKQSKSKNSRLCLNIEKAKKNILIASQNARHQIMGKKNIAHVKSADFLQYL